MPIPTGTQVNFKFLSGKEIIPIMVFARKALGSRALR